MRTLIDRITSLSVRFKWITILLTVIFLVGGIYSATQLNQELIPDVEFPQTFILSQNGGASSDQVLTLFNRPIEENVKDVPEVVNIETTSNDGFGFAIVRNEFGADQDKVTDALQVELDALPLPTRILEPPQGMTPADLIEDLSPEVMLWLYNWSRIENSPFLSVLNDEVWDALSPQTIGVLPEAAFDEIAPRQRQILLAKADAVDFDGEKIYDPVTVPPPALPTSWQTDPRFATAQDLVEMTSIRSMGQVLNDLIEDGYIEGPLVTVSDLTVEDVQIFIAAEAACRAFLAENTNEGRNIDDSCSYVGELDSDTILALPTDILTALPTDFLTQISTADRNAIAQVQVAEALSRQEIDLPDSELPDAWQVEAPRLLTFSFSDLPVGVLSIRSETLTVEQLLDFVNNDLAPRLEELDLIANITVDGGEIIPPRILNAALEAEGMEPLEERGAAPVAESPPIATPEPTPETAGTESDPPSQDDADAPSNNANTCDLEFEKGPPLLVACHF